MLNRPIEETVALVLALIPAFAVHEFAHAWVAYLLGDATAKNLGRLTLNPLKHLDPVGTLMVLVAGFGWAKPVPVNPSSLRYGRRGLALVAVVGPLSNLLMAAVVALVWRATGYVGGEFVIAILLTFVFLNLALLFFNLIPVAPLDGFKVLTGLLPEPLAERWARTARVGPLILLGLIVIGIFIPQLDILGRFIWGPTEVVASWLLQ